MNLYDKCEKWLIPLWGILWIAGITGVSVGVVIWSFKWILSSLGVL